MKVPPLIINLKNIEKRNDTHEKHNKHKKHKKHKKHHKHHKHSHHHSSHSSHSHHHHNHHHHQHLDEQLLDQQSNVQLDQQQQQQQPLQPPSQSQAQLLAPLAHPPLLEPVELADYEELPPIYPLPSLPSPHADTTAPEPATAPEDKKPEEVNAVETQQPTSETPDTLTEVKQSEDVVVVVNDVAPANVDGGQNDQMPEFVKQLKGNSRISFLRMTDDGSVTLGIIGPRKDEIEDTNEKILNLEQICGQLNEGIEVIPSDIDEEEIKDTIQVRPVDTIEPTPFGSYLPVHDSTFSNLTKEDTETLLEVYGSDPVCLEYAKSLQEFSSGSDYLMDIVDSVLDLLTEGRHSKEVLPIRQKLIDKQVEDKPTEDKVTEDKPAEDKPMEDKPTEDKPMEDKPIEDKPAEDKPTDDKPMDVDAQDDEFKKNQQDGEDDDDVQRQLNEIDELLNRLKDIQERRLSSSPAPIDPDATETQLAEEITSKMTKLIKEKAKPGEICESESVLKALGIEVN